ncbi:ABC transporter ATP-binding protein [Bacillus sp. FJAT-29937]|uniref:ABC transporter ATP-binding protein n=1 Tax=Bacillus sp. FJAT-29937 TaxID=1720553 RepID=UPI00082BB91A|nr:dipeptide ABC transporter ATP-binding protein [Bacillus sp. FJAT-29937]
MLGTETDQRNPVLQVKDLKKHFKIKKTFGAKPGIVKAVNNVSFDLYEGETLGIVGESGCGKSTTGRSLLRLIEPNSGSVLLDGQDILKIHKKDLMAVRKNIQMVFQDPFSSLNPRIRIGNALEESLKIHNIGTKNDRIEMVLEILNKVGLNEEQYYRFPHEFSGGQRQRIGLARALIVNPKVVVCDEPVSALDVSVQSQIINLLRQIQRESNVSYLFIAHDISVVRHISDRIGVMYLGYMVEEAPVEGLFANPYHPYTQALLSAVPIPNPGAKKERIILKGEIPSPLNPPSGCVFHTRCPYTMEICKKDAPPRIKVGEKHFVSCYLLEK